MLVNRDIGRPITKARWNYCRSSDVWVPKYLGPIWAEYRVSLERRLPRDQPGLAILESPLDLFTGLVQARILMTPG